MLQYMCITVHILRTGCVQIYSCTMDALPSPNKPMATIFLKLMSCDFNNNNKKLINDILFFINKNFEIRNGHLPDNYINNIVAVYTLCAFLLILNVVLFHF
jgi:hypothetical protein